MTNKGDTYAEILRALGRFLDEEHAHDAEIFEHPTFLAASWRTRDGSTTERSYDELGLQTLRARARRLRGGLDGPPPPGDLSDLMRTLGQELDEMGFDLARIQEDEDGFVVSETVADLYQSLYIRKVDLLVEATGRRAMRTLDVEPPSRDDTRNKGWRFWKR